MCVKENLRIALSFCLLIYSFYNLLEKKSLPLFITLVFWCCIIPNQSSVRTITNFRCYPDSVVIQRRPRLNATDGSNISNKRNTQSEERIV